MLGTTNCDVECVFVLCLFILLLNKTFYFWTKWKIQTDRKVRFWQTNANTFFTTRL